MSQLIRTAIYGMIMMLAVSLPGLTSPMQAGVQLDIVAKFWNGAVELDIVTIVDSEVEASKSKVALLGIATPLRSSFSFRREEWLLLIELWSKAVKSQSDSWKTIGSMIETETSHASVLTISAGPGIKFVINSPGKGLVTYVLSKDELARFAGTLYRVKEFFHDSAAGDRNLGTSNLVEAATSPIQVEPSQLSVLLPIPRSSGVGEPPLSVGRKEPDFRRIWAGQIG